MKEYVKNNIVGDYLAEVREYLFDLPDKEQIINELRTHIWDMANDISVKEGVSVNESFILAVSRMEDPKLLGEKFLSEANVQTIDWTANLTKPETKVTDEQFILIAAVGLAFVALITLMFSFSIEDSWFFWIVNFSIGVLVISVFIALLYFSDEKLFREQVSKFRDSIKEKAVKIEKKTSEMKVEAKLQKSTKQISKSYERQKPTLSAFGAHLGGILGMIFIAFLMGFLFIIDITGALPLYNDNWYIIGSIVVYISLGAGFIKSFLQALLGQIRVSRLISAIVNSIDFLCDIVLVLMYPFTIALTIQETIAHQISNPEVLSILNNADIFFHFFIAILAAIHLISAIYDLFKFSAWTSDQRKSLL